MSFSPFIDQSGAKPDEKLDFWEPIIITKEEIDAEIERLASIPRPANGRRQSMMVHPRWAELGKGPGMTPGIRVTLEVLNPGEETVPIRHNSTQANFCIQGKGASIINGKRIDFGQYDTWNFPSMATYRHVNDSDDLHVRFTYSNAPLLEKMNVHVVEENPPAPELKAVETEDKAEAAEAPLHIPKTVDIGDGAWLMPYETLINPTPVKSDALYWPWERVKGEIDKLGELNKNYKGRRLYMMWNPATGRHNGITPSFFATITIRPGGIVDRPHRHTSAAINYYFAGAGRSTVEGKVYEWKAGDLMLSAPGWAVHNHASYDETVYELTIQDQPLNIYMESLMWQEDLKKPWRILGSDIGFETNIGEIAKKAS
jgi:gentisate 1,2-dioxygenase